MDKYQIPQKALKLGFSSLDMFNVFFDPYKNFKIQTYWSDENTFPDPLDSGEIFECSCIEEAIIEAFQNIRPQVKRYIETEIEDDNNARLTYFPTPSKNKNGYTETVEITRTFKQIDPTNPFAIF
jgi:hypothetical protein